jgi:hypothetical protein
MIKIQNFESVKLRRFLSKLSILILILGVFSCQKEDDFMLKQEKDVSITKTNYTTTRIEYETVQKN